MYHSDKHFYPEKNTAPITENAEFILIKAGNRMENLPVELQKKLDALKDYIRDLGSLAVGFSGGVDSTF